MSQSLALSPLVTHEPVPAVAVSAPILAVRPLSLPVGVLPYALPAVPPDRANRKPWPAGIRRAVHRANTAHLRRDEYAPRVSVLARATTFPGRGVCRAGCRRQLDTRH